MSVQYQAILWNPQKKIYDGVLASAVVLYLALFIGAGAWVHPNATAETLIIRGFGTAAFILLHVILCIGPLARLNPRFLPLLYNRRHLGVTMFMLALVHGGLSTFQFHALGDANPVVSLLSSPGRFQQLGLIALMILFFMAATSHDFWLKNLSAAVWKRLHMLVYIAYALLVAHVSFGALQSERNPTLVIFLMAGIAAVTSLHLLAARKEHLLDATFVSVCELERIPENRAVIVNLGDERVAVFKHEGKVSAISNVCAHQNGPLGEGRIVDGCVTCPWHGYQFRPETGESPPPFKDKVPVYPVKVENGKVWVSPCPKSST